MKSILLTATLAFATLSTPSLSAGLMGTQDTAQKVPGAWNVRLVPGKTCDDLKAFLGADALAANALFLDVEKHQWCTLKVDPAKDAGMAARLQGNKDLVFLAEQDQLMRTMSKAE